MRQLAFKARPHQTCPRTARFLLFSSSSSHVLWVTASLSPSRAMPHSPASTVRGSDSPADDVAREGFLASALSRLGLTSPVAAGRGTKPESGSGPGEGNTSAPPPRESRTSRRKEGRRRPWEAG